MRRVLRLAACRSASSVAAYRSASSVAALPTRKQHVKEHLTALRAQDPDRWTARALSSHFGVPLANIQAMLTLQALEAERGELDPMLVELAEDAEEYLDFEYAESPPERPPSAEALTAGSKETFYDADAGAAAPSPSVALDELSLEQEQALVAAVAERFRGAAAPGVGPSEALGAAVRSAVGDLSLEELRELSEQVGASPAGSVPADAEEATERHTLARSILHSLSSDAPAALLDAPAGSADLGTLELPWLPARQSGVATPAPSAVSASSDSALANEGAFWVDGTLPSPKLAAPIRPVADDVLPAADYGSARTVEQLKAVKVPDFADALHKNVEMRARNLAAAARGEGGIHPKRGGYIFTELKRAHKKVQYASQVWVAERDGGIRQPTESEGRTAKVRARGSLPAAECHMPRATCHVPINHCPVPSCPHA